MVIVLGIVLDIAAHKIEQKSSWCSSRFIFCAELAAVGCGHHRHVENPCLASSRAKKWHQQNVS